MKPSLLIGFDSMRNENCGYFSFGKGLGNSLLRNNNNRFDLTYYMFKDTNYSFSDQPATRYYSVLDELFFKRKNNYDLVHLTDQGSKLKPSLLAGKKVMTIHDMNKVHLKYSKPHRIEVYLKKMRSRINLCDKIVTISKFVANDVLNYFPEAADKLSVIYNGADKLIVPKNHHPKFIPPGPFIFTIGLMSVQKGFHLLPALLKENHYHLVIAGIETSHKKTILEEAKKNGCLDRVHITGAVSEADKAWYYQNCKAFTFPSIAEGFGLPVIEAFHFGKPVFTTTLTSLPEVGGEVAYYFNSFDPDEMREVFLSGIEDFQTRDRSFEAKAWAEQFSWDKCGERYLKLYDECLNS